jgi:hypothetical protein
MLNGSGFTGLRDEQDYGSGFSGSKDEQDGKAKGRVTGKIIVDGEWL